MMATVAQRLNLRCIWVTVERSSNLPLRRTTSRNGRKNHFKALESIFSNRKLLYIFIAFTQIITNCAIPEDKENLQDNGKLPRDGLYFDSRKHVTTGRTPLDTNAELFPTIPEPDIANEYSEDMGRNAYNSSDYNSTFDMSGDFIANLRRKLYRGPVCALIDVRNSPFHLRDLENCTIVNGFVQLTFMHDTTASSFEQYSFPKLRVITEYLLVYRVYGLRSLKKLFPNLSVIRGRQVFYNYGLIVYENPQLREIGLGNLRHIERGGVRIQKNAELCYLDTVDWERIGVTEKIMLDNGLYDDGACLDHCSDDASCVDHPKTATEHCWGANVCQQQQCPSDCPHACENGKCVCHEECLAGCLEHNNASACRACLHKHYNGECVKDCPDDTYLERDWRCISWSACVGLAGIPHEVYDDKEGKVIKKCLDLCPPNHIEEYDYIKGEAYCKDCNSTCEKVCDEEEYVVTDGSTAARLNGCTKIPGSLVINHLGGDDALDKLERSLRGLTELGSLSIQRTPALVSLNFLSGLKRITGNNLIDRRYSIYIINNPNLQQLFPIGNSSDSDKLRIDNGLAFFHFNPKLCPKEIEHISHLTAGKEDDKDISTITNGDRGTCDMLPLIITSIDHMPMENNDLASVRIKWKKVDVVDPRTLIGYQLFYRESKHQNAKPYEGRNVCTQVGGSGWNIKDDLLRPQTYSSTNSNESNNTLFAFLHNLKPYTQYAIYIMTYTTSIIQDGAQSNITYFTTNPARPTEPTELKAYAVNATAIKLRWKPPILPNGIITHYIVRWRKQEEDTDYISKVDTCRRERNAAAAFKKPTSLPITTQAPEVTAKEECCSCGKKPSHMELEDEALDKIDFENHLHRKLFTVVVINYNFDDFARSRRSTDGSAPQLSNASSSNGSSSDYSDYEDIKSSNGNDYDYTSSYGNYFNYYNEAEVEGEEYTVTQLRHYSDYEIQVYACNHASINSSTMCSLDSMRTMRTHFIHEYDDIPDDSLERTEIELDDGVMQREPRTRCGYMQGDLLVTQSYSAAKSVYWPAIKWKPPEDPNGFVKSYDIDIQYADQVETTDSSSDNIYCYSVYKFNQNKQTYLIPTVKAAGPYRARIRAVTLAGKGRWTRFLKLDIPQSAAERATARRQNTEIGVAVVVVFVVIVAILAIFTYKLKRRKAIRKAMVYSSTNPEYVSLAANYIPDGYEVDIEDVELIKVIGHGNFGKVYVGFAKNVIKGEARTQVAIKKLHEKSGIRRRYDFLEEAKLMKAFSATHVVRLLGVVSQTADPMVLMEYMAQGDLKSYLRSRRDEIEAQDTKASPPTLPERLQMAAEIADGMAYLADIKYVHRDLAARNCLVSKETVVKIGDFGLARDVYETDYYRKDSRGLLPIRWMAPESLRDGVFDFRSDVWSYGVVLWEIATLAQQPYQGRQHDEVTRYVIDGGYMEKPKNCPKKLYDLMLSCWEFNPEMRPKFKEILSSLANDVSERFKRESYFFETNRAKFEETLKNRGRQMEGEMTYMSCDDHYLKEDAFRVATPLNVTPSRSRCETPSGYHTPNSRYSNGSEKVGCDMLAHCDHLKRIDATELKNMTPCAQMAGSKQTARIKGIPHKRENSNRKADSIIKRLSGNSATRVKGSPPPRVRMNGDGIYYSVSSGSLGADDESDCSTSEDATMLQAIPTAESNSNQQIHTSPTPKLSQKERHDDIFMIPRSRPQADVNIGSDAEKPYAHMNGFVNRLDSLGRRHGSPFRHSSKRTTSSSEESSYVESSPQNSAKYFESRDFRMRDVAFESAPPPPSSPPPLPPVGHSS